MAPHIERYWCSVISSLLRFDYHFSHFTPISITTSLDIFHDSCIITVILKLCVFCSLCLLPGILAINEVAKVYVQLETTIALILGKNGKRLILCDSLQCSQWLDFENPKTSPVSPYSIFQVVFSGNFLKL